MRHIMVKEVAWMIIVMEEIKNSGDIDVVGMHEPYLSDNWKG